MSWVSVKLYLRMQMQVELSINWQTTEAAVLVLSDPGLASAWLTELNELKVLDTGESISIKH